MNGIVITVVAISTGCIIPMSTGVPINIKYGNGYSPDTKNHMAIINAMYGKFFLKNETFSIFFEPHLLQIVPCLFTQDVHTIFEHIAQDLLPNLDPHISQDVNSINIWRQYVKMFYHHLGL
jgi:hypothetical protein